MRPQERSSFRKGKQGAKVQFEEGLQKGPKGVLKTGFVWCVQKLIKVVKKFNVLNANSGLIKIVHP